MERIEKTIIVIGSTDAANIENYERERSWSQGKVIKEIKVKNKNYVRNKSPLGNWKQTIDWIQARQWSCKLNFRSNETEKYWVIE